MTGAAAADSHSDARGSLYQLAAVVTIHIIGCARISFPHARRVLLHVPKKRQFHHCKAARPTTENSHKRKIFALRKFSNFPQCVDPLVKQYLVCTYYLIICMNNEFDLYAKIS